MPDQDQNLCDNCHERPGTNHICYGGDLGKGRSLCQVCLMQDSEVGGLIQRLNEALRTGHCKHCDAPAETGSGGYSLVEGDRFDLLCQVCQNDLQDFDRQPENTFPNFRSAVDDAAKKQMLHEWIECQRRRDEFIKQKVLERKSKGDA
ncbi:MAG TPA: hypothetical protein VK811_10625 [Candidatus Acidoferrum sp.]|jgi:hypothetical protein|nr:hypothetical protein [Candidatus Acidoferrum sp.]